VKIHDALIYELIKPDKSGKPTGDILKIVESEIIYHLEEYYPLKESIKGLSTVSYAGETIIQEMTPDIEITTLPLPVTARYPMKKIVIELETDVDFDFGASLRQIKKYRNITPDVRVIIPKEYEMFAPFYVNEGFRVWFWEATRKWQCLRCKNITEIEGPFTPKCMKCKTYSPNRLIGLKDTKFEEFS